MKNVTHVGYIKGTEGNTEQDFINVISGNEKKLNKNHCSELQRAWEVWRAMNTRILNGQAKQKEKSSSSFCIRWLLNIDFLFAGSEIT